MLINVGTVPIPVYPAGAGAALTIFNNGTGTVFLGSDSSVSASNGLPLAYGSTIVWDKGSPLWVVCAPSNSASLYMVFNGGPSSLGSVNLNPGATVGIASGSSVGVNSLPIDTSHYWPCLSGESYPPSLASSNTAYGAQNGNAAITFTGGNASSTSTNALASYNAISRHATDSTLSLMVTGLVYLPNGSGAYTAAAAAGFAIGYPYPRATYVHFHEECNGFLFDTSSGAAHLYLNVNGSSYNTGGNTAEVPLTNLSVGGQWAKFELIYNNSLTRLTLNDDPVMRAVSDPVLDSNIGGAFGAGLFKGLAANIAYYSSSYCAISNLVSQYVTDIPA